MNLLHCIGGLLVFLSVVVLSLFVFTVVAKEWIEEYGHKINTTDIILLSFLGLGTVGVIILIALS